jgi:hypothetical protein
MRLTLAPASMLTDTTGLNEKARPYLRGSDRVRAMVSQCNKATGKSADNTLAGHGFNESGVTDTSKRANSLSLRCPDRSIGVGDERPTIRETSPSY